MNRLVLTSLLFLSVVSSALAADDGISTTSSAGGPTVKEVLKQGYEIRAASVSGAKTILFLQKDTSAYACEFVTVAKSRCGQIN